MSDFFARPMRRVVTGSTDDGVATIREDGPPPRTLTWGETGPRAKLAVVWGDDEPPRRATLQVDRTPDLTQYFPGPPGSYRVVLERFDPHYGVDAGISQAMRAAFREADLDLTMEADDDGGFHTTATVDFGVVLEGRIELVTADRVTTLQRGDVVVQTGVSHTWRNSFEEPCEMAFILIGAAG